MLDHARRRRVDRGALARMFPAAVLAFTTGCVSVGPADGAGGRAVPPRLVVRPPEDIHVEGRRASRTLRFAMAVENRGPGDLELVGREDPETGRTVAVQQVLARPGGDGPAVDHELAVGTLAFDGHHGHWHLGGFARFELLDERLAPAVGARPASKVSACLRDSEKLRLRDGAFVPGHFVCSSEHQGLSVGWADVYDSSLPGQEVEIAGTPDGVYLLVITLTAPFESAGSSSERVGAARLRLTGRTVEVIETLDGRALEELRPVSAAACGCAGGCSCGGPRQACGCARRHAITIGRQREP